MLAISEASTLKRAVTPAVMQRPKHIDETLWQGLDFLLAEMAKRDMKAVLYLNNFWQWSGGMSQYVAWFNGKPVVDPDVTGDWNAFMDNSAAFYREPKAQEAFRFAIGQLITRKNSVNGRLYVDGSDHHVLAARQRAASGQRCQCEAALRCVREVDRRDGGLHQDARAAAAREHGQRRLDGYGGSRELFVRSHTTRTSTT